MSANGTVITGRSEALQAYRAFRWTQATGIQDLGTLGGRDSSGWAISADGEAIVGQSETADGVNSHAFRWTSQSGMQDLGTLGGPESFASSITANGAAVLGIADLDSGSQTRRIFLWTAVEGMRHLGGFGAWSPGYSGPSISGDGVVVVATNPADGPMIWTSSTGAVRLVDFLADQGLELRTAHGLPWQLLTANAISGDGSAIVGDGLFSGQPRAYVITGIQIACAPPEVATQPSNVLLCPTATANIGCAVIGSESMAYAWEVKNSSNAWQAITNSSVPLPCPGGLVHVLGTDTPSLSISIDWCAAGSDSSPGMPTSLSIRCTVTNACGSVVSSPATLTICPADVSCSGDLTVQDIFVFLAAWFGGNVVVGNFNGDCCITVQDIFDFLAAWFQGC